jgi:hypothetical protein
VCFGWSQGHGKTLLNSKIQSIDLNFHHFRTQKTLRDTRGTFEACVLPAAGVWRRARIFMGIWWIWWFNLNSRSFTGINCGIFGLPKWSNMWITPSREGICLIYSRISGVSEIMRIPPNILVCVGTMQINHDQQLDLSTLFSDKLRLQINKSTNQ